jgi:glucokinase
MAKKYRIGIDAGGTKIDYGLFLGDEIVYRCRYLTDKDADGPDFCDRVIDTIHNILGNNGLEFDDLIGVGICMPSFILFDEGYICMTSAMVNIHDFPMKKYLSERLPVKIVLDNDANCAALAEHRHGAGIGSRHMVYVAVGTGIGSGIIINEELFRGSYGWAGECGHMIATPNEGLECGCQNRGCFMSYASGRYAPLHVEKKLKEGKTSILSQCEKLNCEQILEASQKNDAIALETIDNMAKYLAVCVFNIYQLLNINLFVFGGGLTNFGDALFKPMRNYFDSLNHIPQPVYFEFAKLKTEFGLIGASELVKNNNHLDKTEAVF